MKRIFSGAQPTGNVHLGNYLGALRNWVALQREYESFFCIVNLHAITNAQNPKILAEKTRELARIYVAVGIDPEVSTIFVQSDVSEHAELTWLLNCITRMSELDEESEAGCVMLLDDADAVRRKFKRAVTDSGTEIRFDSTRPAINNLPTIYQLLTQKSPEEIEEHFAGKGYAQLKAELAGVTIEFWQPFQERVRGIDDDKLDEILKAGVARAQSIAGPTLAQAKRNMGLIGAKSAS